ncbi:hypothetical protein Acor_34840 [Acrocarpospora corrugata]|uniref:Calcineurin-like phosphoesterase domain-containing protein n=1 Tax=Acrocarpospora corrugata TaxID=35763 RepID=A0A5M3VZP3_9ACTN|nr:hypothetical protein Acor_34840 [Acrocarpospora corrugata]
MLHALGAAVMLRHRRGIKLDALIQVGDLGAFPSPERWDEPSRRFAADSPAQGDFFRLLDPAPRLAEGVRLALEEVPAFLFVSGNHEDHDWLATLHGEAAVTPVDPLGAYRHVACGQVVDVAGQRVGFLGLADMPGRLDFDPDAYAQFRAAVPGSVDILITHDGPHGMSRNVHGVTQGSAKLTALIEHLQPRLHVSGHYHHESGPRQYGRTRSYALAQLVPPKITRWSPEPVNPGQSVAAGGVALLDTDTDTFEYIGDPWLAEVSGDDLDLAALVTAARAS